MLYRYSAGRSYPTYNIQTTIATCSIGNIEYNCAQVAYRVVVDGIAASNFATALKLNRQELKKGRQNTYSFKGKAFAMHPSNAAG